MATDTITAPEQASRCIWNIKERTLDSINPTLRPDKERIEVELPIYFANSKSTKPDVVFTIKYDRHNWQVNIKHRRSFCIFFESRRVKRAIEATITQKWKPTPYMEAEAGYIYCNFFNNEQPKPNTNTCGSTNPSSAENKPAANAETNQSDIDLLEWESVSRPEDAATPLLPENKLTEANTSDVPSEVINQKTKLHYCERYRAVEKWVLDSNLKHCKVSRRVEIEQKYLSKALVKLHKYDLPKSGSKAIVVPITLTERGWPWGNHAILALVTIDSIFIVDPKDSNPYPYPLNTLSTRFQAWCNWKDCTRHTLYTLKHLLPKIEEHFVHPPENNTTDTALSLEQLENYLVNIPRQSRQYINAMLYKDMQ